MMTDEAVPALGAAIRKDWTLDPDWLTVNHGAYGATPRRVLAAQVAWQARMEAQPSRFMNDELPAALRQAAGELAGFLGANGDDLVFVENATVGCNAVLRSLPFSQGDEVLVLDHGYNAVRNAVRYVTERVGARMTEAAVPFPQPDAQVLLANLAAAITPRTRLAVLDHVTSPSAFVLPIKEMVDICHARGVKVLVDGAHGPGQLTIDLAALGADWYVGNCHKWLCAPKGGAFLWAAPDAQADLHPVTISHGFGSGFRAEFDWTGTRDASAFLAVPVAIAFHHELGGAALRARNRALAREGAGLIARRLNTGTGASGEFAGCMGLVRLPVAGEHTREDALALRAKLLRQKTDAPVMAIDGALWMRLSAHAYNEPDDYLRLADCLAHALR
jgi:isopenicillin-N epimerase